MEKFISINYLAILIAVVANMVFGFLWFGPIFGKIWAKEMGFPADFKPSNKQFAVSMIIMVIGSFLTAWVLAHSQDAWMYIDQGMAAAGLMQMPTKPVFGFFSAFFTFIGFFLPLVLGQVAWENKSWLLFSINAAYHFLNLQITSQILIQMN